MRQQKSNALDSTSYEFKKAGKFTENLKTGEFSWIQAESDKDGLKRSAPL